MEVVGMKIKWLGHASFLITSDSGVRVITDPYHCTGGIEYGPIQETADVVTVSHQHQDHNNVAAVKGNPTVVDVPGVMSGKGIEFLGVPSYHDGRKGAQRGPNSIFCFAIDGVRVCHLGDLGHELDAGKVKEIGGVDVLLVPVGGFYTIDARQATGVCEALKPRVVIPMHVKTAKCDYPITGVEDFLKGRRNVSRLAASETEINKDKLPSETETVVLQHAL
jgi:L-ascorbate metabolism protein UlaG (beta-lactamase superfamily)